DPGGPDPDPGGARRGYRHARRAGRVPCRAGAGEGRGDPPFERRRIRDPRRGSAPHPAHARLQPAEPGGRGMTAPAVPAAGALARLRAGLVVWGGWRRIGMAAALGALAAAALPPVYAVFVLPVSFTGLLWLIEAGGRSRTAFAAGWWFGFGYFAAGLYWVASAFMVEAARYGWMAPFAVAGLAAYLALF